MPHRKLLFLTVISALIIIPVVVFGLSKIFPNEKEAILSAIDPVRAKENEGSGLEQIAHESLLKEKGEYAIFVKNLKSEESYFYNETKQFDSASLYKLWVMAVAFQKIKDGVLRRDEVLSAPMQNLDDILSTTTPTPSPSMTPEQSPSPTPVPMISMKASDAIEKMITVSDNYAALLVASRSGSFAVTNFLKEYGFDDSSFRQPPKTTVGDIGLFFEKAYNGEIIDQEYSDKMIEILKKQNLNDRIPKYLPRNLEIAHKTGELFNSKHDAGIVFGSKGDYIIVVLSETKNPDQAAENIANFSKAVYDYFNSL